MATKKSPARAVNRRADKEGAVIREVPHTRSHFNLLLASNPNYFSNLDGSPFPGVLKQKGDTTYEQVECAGLNPQLDMLEAVIRVKQSVGYNGDICSKGSLEYVRFYADYANSNTWTDLGFSTIRVHDIPGPKPICYNAKLSIDPPRNFCTKSNTIKVRAILSWNALPPANTPNHNPVWGNVLDVHVQIRPTLRKPWGDVLVDLEAQATLPKALAAQLNSFDKSAALTVSQTPNTLAELERLYRNAKVPVHRFAFAELQKAIASPTTYAGLTAGESLFSDLLPSKKDIEAMIATLAQPASDTSYEQVTCVGLRPEDDTVGAIVSIKRPTGYLGGLCTPGSVEYVAFWLETAPNVWDYLGTSGVRVHDLNAIPAGGVEYAVYLPVDLSSYFRKCTDGAVVRRLRAVLQWNVPPSAIDPNQLPHWGNRSECRVQLRPGDPEQALVPTLLDISNVPADGAGINQATGLTVAFDAPFGGTVAIRAIMGGYPATPRQYKLQVRKSGDVTWRTLNNPIQVRFFQFDGIGNVIDCSAAPGFQVECVKTLDAPLDWYDYINTDTGGVKTVLVDNTIGYWHTTIADEGLWEIKATFRDSSISPEVDTQIVKVRIDNTAPSVHAQFDHATLPSGQCGKFNPGAVVTGTYSTNDAGSNPLVPDATISEFQHFYAIQAVLIPGGLIPHAVSLDGLGSTRVLGNMGGNGTFSLDTAGGTPCGYVIRFIASDRTIYGYLSGAVFNTTSFSNEYDVGFCLG
jgi:hypothetical protein